MDPNKFGAVESETLSIRFSGLFVCRPLRPLLAVRPMARRVTHGLAIRCTRLMLCAPMLAMVTPRGTVALFSSG